MSSFYLSLYHQHQENTYGTEPSEQWHGSVSAINPWGCQITQSSRRCSTCELTPLLWTENSQREDEVCEKDWLAASQTIDLAKGENEELRINLEGTELRASAA